MDKKEVMIVKEEATNRKSSVLMPVLMGSAVGAGIMLLLAPKSGREIRKDLKRFAANMKDRAAEVIGGGKDLYEEGGEVVAGAVKAGKETYDAGTERLEELMHKKESSLMVPILAGGIIGVGVALLLASKSGTEVRGDLKRMAADTRDKLVTAIDKSRAPYMEGKKSMPEAV